MVSERSRARSDRASSGSVCAAKAFASRRRGRDRAVAARLPAGGARPHAAHHDRPAALGARSRGLGPRPQDERRPSLRDLPHRRGDPLSQSAAVRRSGVHAARRDPASRRLKRSVSPRARRLLALSVAARSPYNRLERSPHPGRGRMERNMTMDSNRERALDLAVSQIEKQFGKGAIMKLGADALIRDISTVSTGSLGLDLALGVGGVPRGRVVEIYGPESSGKTTLALQIIAEAQKQGGSLRLHRRRARARRRLRAQARRAHRGSAHLAARQRRAGARDRRDAGAQRGDRRARRRLGGGARAARRDRGRHGRSADGPAGAADVAGAAQAHRRPSRSRRRSSSSSTRSA